MAFQTPITIKEATDNIHRNQYLLPAIQREFVWRPDQIERLFDSLMRGYPIGSFLFWRVDPKTAKDYSFYQFITNYDQRKPHNRVHGAPSTVPGLKAVLDGQQRLTALNVGIHGSGKWKLPRLWWNNPCAFPERRLYLNLLASRKEDEEELSYKFRLLPPGPDLSCPERRSLHAGRRNDHEYWYRVGKILDVKNAEDLIDVVHDLGLAATREPQKMLTRLYHVVHANGIISAYEENDQNPDRVLNIFVRANSGGTPLSYSDMLLSMAVAQWDSVDARKEIHALVDQIRSIGRGFSFNHDFVLKACLMLGDSDSIRFKVENFRKSKMGALQNQWDRIRRTITATVELASSFGYSGQSLTSANALLPIAYYLHHRQPSPSDKDRKTIRYWLIRSLLKLGTWGSGVDNLLVAIRTAIRESSWPEGFPTREIERAMRSRGKSMTFDDEELQDLADASYGGRASSLLILLYSFVDVATHQFHIDHVFPRALMTPGRLKKAGVDDEQLPDYRDRVDRLANLQLLEASKHAPKGTKLPADWLRGLPEDEMNHHCQLHDLGDVPADVTGFLDFYEIRRTRIIEKLRRLLVSDST